VKLCKHDTPLLFAPSGANHEQGLGWDRVCAAQRSNESPSGAFKRQSGLAQARWRGIAPTSSVGFAIKGITECGERQDGFAKFMVIKWKAQNFFATAIPSNHLTPAASML